MEVNNHSFFTPPGSIIRKKHPFDVGGSILSDVVVITGRQIIHISCGRMAGRKIKSEKEHNIVFFYL